jgi:isochorismate pyruvate lyase
VAPAREWQEMKQPEECRSLEEIRAEIDRLDRQVIAALAERFAYVKAIVRFKSDETSVRAPERFEAVMRERRRWAEEAGLSGEVIEKLYRDLVGYFLEEELKHWRRQAGGGPPTG